MAQNSSASALHTFEGHQILSADKFKSAALAPKHRLGLAFCVPAWWCTDETVHGGEGWIPERWKQFVSPRAQEEVSPEMWDWELPLLLLSSIREEGVVQEPRSEDPAQVLLFTSLQSSNWKSK